jgi:HEAT repeat protein
VYEDPVYTRWKRRYPKFPGVARCVELLRRRNTQGSLVDIICGELEDNAAAHAAELLSAFRAEPSEHVRLLLLGIIADARLPEALPLLVEQLRSPDERLRRWASRGLQALNTPEARKALWEAGVTRDRAGG